MVTLRQRNRRNAMRLTQRTALDLFIERGFDEVTISEIADAVGMAPSTLYRHFSTKEAIVLWDEHDASIEEALVRELRRQPPFAAMREAFVAELGSRYDDDQEFQLQRVRYIYSTEQLHAAAVEADLRETMELADGLRHFLSAEHRADAPLLAGAAMLALDVAFDRWQQGDGATPLGQLIAASFDALEDLGSIS